LFTFRIRHDGTLMPLPDNVVEETFDIVRVGDDSRFSEDGISIDPTGRFLYLSANTGFINHRESSFASYRLDAHGMLHALTPVAYWSGLSDTLFGEPRGGLFVNRYIARGGTYRLRNGLHGLSVPMSLPVILNQYARLTTNGSEGETLWTEEEGGDYRKHNLASYRVGLDGRLTLKAAHAATVPSLWRVTASRRERLFYVADYDEASQRDSFLLAFAITPQETLKALTAKPPLLDGPCLSLVVGEGQ